MVSRSLSRRLARLAAVQALYQMEMTRGDANEVIDEFLRHRLQALPQTSPPQEPDREHFIAVIRGVVARQREIDRKTNDLLKQTWSLHRIDSTLRAILRASAYELLEMTSVPANVVINEYLETGHSFFQDKEISFLNGVLDHLARELRPDEFAGPGTAQKRREQMS